MGTGSIIENSLAAGKKTAEIAAQLRERVDLLPEILDALSVDNKRVKNAAWKVLNLLSETHPEELYGEADRFIEALDSDENIGRWNAADILGNLAQVDTARKINRAVVSTLLTYLDDDSMVTAAHGVDNLCKIARANPRERRRITSQLLLVRNANRDASCNTILARKTIVALGMYFEQITAQKDAVLEFVRGELRRGDESTQRVARKFLTRYGSGTDA